MPPGSASDSARDCSVCRCSRTRVASAAYSRTEWVDIERRGGPHGGRAWLWSRPSGSGRVCRRGLLRPLRNSTCFTVPVPLAGCVCDHDLLRESCAARPYRYETAVRSWQEHSPWLHEEIPRCWRGNGLELSEYEALVVVLDSTVADDAVRRHCIVLCNVVEGLPHAYLLRDTARSVVRIRSWFEAAVASGQGP